MSVRVALKAALEADTTLMAILTGGVWDQPINRRTTPEAFDVGPAGTIKPCISLADGGAQADASGIAGAMAGTITLWIRASQSDEGRDAIEDATARIIRLFDMEVIDLGGRGAMLELAGTLEGSIDPFVEGARFRYVQFRALEVWA